MTATLEQVTEVLESRSIESRRDGQTIANDGEFGFAIFIAEEDDRIVLIDNVMRFHRFGSILEFDSWVGEHL